MVALLLQPLFLCLGLGIISAGLAYGIARSFGTKGSSSDGSELRVLLVAGTLSTAAITFFCSAGKPLNLFKGTRAGYPEMYALLTESYAAGRLDILEKPSKELLALPNPYDPVANARHRIHDAILYQGKYYLYYSPVPVFLLNMPVWKITGTHLSQAAAVSLFASLGMWAALGTLRILRRSWFPAAPREVFIFLMLSVAFLPSLMHLAGRPAVYEEAISAGYCFLMFGGLFLAQAMTKTETKLRWGLVSACCFALAIGCRPNLTLACPFFGLAWLYLLRLPKAGEGPESRKIDLLDFRPWLEPKRLGQFALLCLPFVLMGAILGGLNWARFGSPTEFGWKWQLWGWKKPAYEAVFFSWRNIGTDFELYFATPPRFISEFPFSSASTYRTYFRSPYNTGAEELLGLMWSMPVILIASLWWLVRGGLPRLRGAEPRQIWFTCLGGAGLSAMVFNHFYSSVAMRYTMDFVPLIQVAGAAAVLFFATKHSLWARPWFRTALIALALFVGYLSLSLGLTSYGTLKAANPELFAALSRCFCALALGR